MIVPVPSDLVAHVLAGDRRALARLVSLIENGAPESRPALAQLHAHGGRAHVIGVTGSPGAGKSTLVMQLARELRRRDRRVGIIAVDPTSPFTGGAILGDRIRMQDLTGDPHVFIRSMASRGSVGGLASATRDVARALDAAGFDQIIIETVGAGQAEVEIVRAAQSIIVVTVPGMGDDIQALKAGILEIADIFCVNKADRPGADQVASELRMLLSLAARGDPGTWRPPILKTIASTGEGVPALVDALDRHLEYLRATGQIVVRGERQARSEILALLYQTLLARLDRVVGAERFAAIVSAVAARQSNPYSATAELARMLGLSDDEGTRAGA
jgi:LAO/AO transport system kinase